MNAVSSLTAQPHYRGISLRPHSSLPKPLIHYRDYGSGARRADRHHLLRGDGPSAFNRLFWSNWIPACPRDVTAPLTFLIADTAVGVLIIGLSELLCGAVAHLKVCRLMYHLCNVCVGVFTFYSPPNLLTLLMLCWWTFEAHVAQKNKKIQHYIRNHKKKINRGQPLT